MHACVCIYDLHTYSIHIYMLGYMCWGMHTTERMYRSHIMMGQRTPKPVERDLGFKGLGVEGSGSSGSG